MGLQAEHCRPNCADLPLRKHLSNLPKCIQVLDVPQPMDSSLNLVVQNGPGFAGCEAIAAVGAPDIIKVV